MRSLNPIYLISLLALAIASASAFDWGRLARGVGEFSSRRRKMRHRISFTAKWKVECGPIGPDGEIRPHTVRELAPNLIVNAGLEAAKDLLFKAATAKVPFSWVAIGTDATAEASGQTALIAEVARHAANYTSGGVGVATVDWTFPAGVGTGTITEGCLVNAAAAGDIFNRKVWSAVVKGAGDALKVSCVVTLAPA